MQYFDNNNIGVYFVQQNIFYQRNKRRYQMISNDGRIGCYFFMLLQ